MSEYFLMILIFSRSTVEITADLGILHLPSSNRSIKEQIRGPSVTCSVRFLRDRVSIDAIVAVVRLDLCDSEIIARLLRNPGSK